MNKYSNINNINNINTNIRTIIQKRNFIKPLLLSLSTIAYSSIYQSTTLANKIENNELHSNKSKNEIELEKLSTRKFFKRPPKLYENHIPTYTYEKMLMFIGSSIGAFLHPERNEFIVTLGESTATTNFLINLRNEMLNDSIGREILKDRPYITSNILNLEKLKTYPENSFGKCYYNWLIRENCSPDTRVDVKFIDDEELAFVFQRYRQCHDFYHALIGLPIFREGEIALKFFEYLNIGIPFAGLGSIFAPWNVKKQIERERLFKIYYPWALKTAYHCKKNLINVYWEKIMDKDVNELRRELNITPPPDMRSLRKLYKKNIAK
mgnify:FL=1